MNMKRFLLAVLLAIITFAATAQNKDNIMSNKSLVVFFSRTGENYAVGNITKGNTHIIAEMISEATGADMFQIELSNPYPDNYSECVDLAKKEKNTKARPQIKGDVNVEGYDVIYIGYPNWWGDMPMAVYTFIEKHDWTGKTVIPFCTHEGSGLSSTESYLKASCKGATVLPGLAVRGETAQNRHDDALKAVNNWISK